MNVLVDTSVWSTFLREQRNPTDPVVKRLEALIRADVVEIIGPIRQELLSGAAPQSRFSALKEYLRWYKDVSLDEEDYENAAHYHNLCRSRGIKATGVDVIICAAAVRHGFRIFSLDKDFLFYSEYLPIRLMKTTY